MRGRTGVTTSAVAAPGWAGNQTTVKAALTDMQTHGVDVVRWWMFQEFNGNNGVELDTNGVPTGAAGGTLVADIQSALALAAQIGVHYNFTLFSFDNFVLATGRHDLGAHHHEQREPQRS